jgi:cardiolipin synthase
MSAASPEGQENPPPVRSVFTRDQMLTWPNGFTFLRLLCIPLFVWLLFGPERRDVAAWLLGVLGATDWVDGWIARRFDQSSEFGRLFDPTVDRLMFFVAIPAILIDGSIPIWVAALALIRELLVAVCAVLSVAVGAGTLAVTWEGKTAAFALMFAVPMFLGANSTLSYADLLGWLAWLFVAPGLAYGYYSLVFQYVPTLRARMKEET